MKTGSASSAAIASDCQVTKKKSADEGISSPAGDAKGFAPLTCATF